jgi:hypothetical protein
MAASKPRAADVLGARHKLHVRGVAASLGAAKMVDREIGRRLAMDKLVRDTVRATELPGVPERAVASRVACGRPWPALVGSANDNA